MGTRIAVAGGGLAGLACAKSLVDAGCSVSIWEGLPFLGGRASTFRDEEGDWIEQGLHLFLGTYSEFKKLLEEIGQSPDDVLHWQSQVRLQDPLGPEATYGSNPLTAPVKTVLSILGQNDFLSIADKLSLAPLTLPSLSSFSSLEKFDDRSVAQLWSECGGTPDTLERVLRPFCRAIQFTDAEDFSAYNFLGWLHHVAYDIPHSLLGAYRGARDELVFAPLGRWLTDRGATIRTGVPVQEITYDAASNQVTSLAMDNGERITADYYICAMPAWNLSSLIPRELQDTPFFSRIACLPTAPAISVQLWFDGPAVEHSDFALVARQPVPVYQDQANLTYSHPAGSRVSATLSPADHLLPQSDDELVRLTVESLASVEPGIASSRVSKSTVLRHEQHLIRPLPGAMTGRPTQVTPVSNLFLAGDWTQQDYFGSQEGAVRSGRKCAEEILGRLG